MKPRHLAVLVALHGALLSAQSPAKAPGAPVYFSFQVEKPVVPDPRNTAPEYPTVLRVANIEGSVVAKFVVDTSGMADMDTFQVLKSDHELFSNAVRQHMPELRFTPAEIGGRKVRQLVQMPFQFSLKKPPAR